MENKKRNIQIKFRVTEEEKKLIEQKTALMPTKQIGAYMRKMAIDGFIIYTDMTDFKKYGKELSAIGRNVNQIAKRLNSTNTIYDNDVKDIKERLDEIWQLSEVNIFHLEQRDRNGLQEQRRLARITRKKLSRKGFYIKVNHARVTISVSALRSAPPHTDFCYADTPAVDMAVYTVTNKLLIEAHTVYLQK